MGLKRLKSSPQESASAGCCSFVSFPSSLTRLTAKTPQYWFQHWGCGFGSRHFNGKTPSKLRWKQCSLWSLRSPNPCVFATLYLVLLGISKPVDAYRHFFPKAPLPTVISLVLCSLQNLHRSRSQPSVNGFTQCTMTCSLNKEKRFKTSCRVSTMKERVARMRFFGYGPS